MLEVGTRRFALHHHTTSTPSRTCYERGHASLCLFGLHLRRTGFFEALERQVKIKPKVLTYRPVQKLEMFLVGLLAGAKAVSHTATTGRVDPALVKAFGLPGCGEQSTIAQTLNAATEQDVADLQAAVAEWFRAHRQAAQHDFEGDLLVLDGDLSPRPSSAKAEGPLRGSRGRSRSKTGRNLVRVRAASRQETVGETVVSGSTARSA